MKGVFSRAFVSVSACCFLLLLQLIVFVLLLLRSSSFPLLFPFAHQAASGALFLSLCRSETVWPKGCWQQILMRTQNSGYFYKCFFFFFLLLLNAQIVDIIVSRSCSSRSVFGTKYFQWQAHAFTATNSHSRSFFIFAPSLSLSFSSAHWYKYTKMWPDRQCHNWLPVQCVSACCSVTQNNFFLSFF